MPNEVTLDTLTNWFKEYEDGTYEARRNAERDWDFYDGLQWTSEELKELARRGQPIITLNRIAPKVNYVLGVEVETRIDPHAYPRGPTHDDDAMIATDALRYVADREDFDIKRSETATDLMVLGIGASIIETEVVTEKVPSSRQTQRVPEGVASIETGELKSRVEIRHRHVPWDRLFWDPHSKKKDFSDAKYMGISTWRDASDVIADERYHNENGDADVKAAIGNSPEAQHELTDDTHDDKPKLWWDTKRKRVRVVEHYWRDGRKWMFAHYIVGGFLPNAEPKPVPHVDELGNNYCPILAARAFVTREKNESYGIVRNMVSPQEEVNKRRSKALHLLNQRQVMYEEGSVQDVHSAQTQLAKPDGAVKLNPGALRDGTFQVAQTGDLANGQFQLMEEAKREIDTIGPSAALVAADTREVSGRLFMARQKAGSMELKPVFDSLRHWSIRVFKVYWFMIRQYWKDERWFRVRDDEERKGFRFVSVNRAITKGERIMEMISKGTPEVMAVRNTAGPEGMDTMSQILQGIAQEQQQAAAMAQQQGVDPAQLPQPDQQQIMQEALRRFMLLPSAQEQMVTNEIARTDVDILIDVAPDTTVIEHEEFSELVSLAQTGQVQIPAEVLLEASSLRSKKKMIAMLKQPDPQQQQQVQMQMQAMQAQIAKLTADAQKAQADAARSMVQAQQGVPAEAERDLAHAAKLGAEAGIASAAPIGGAGGQNNP